MSGSRSVKRAGGGGRPIVKLGLSAVQAAAEVLSRARSPMSAKALVERMAARGLWRSPAGKTPQATLYVEMMREIKAKGKASRFRRRGRGLFVAAR